MRKIHFLLFAIFIVLASCHKDDDDQPTDPVDQLPPATQTGAGTFGCLLDGEVFLPGNTPNNLDCVYQFVDGGYYFALQGTKRETNNDLILIGLGTNKLQIEEGVTYPLFEFIEGNASGTYFYNLDRVYTTHTQEN
jgi:hypothetical protein